MRVLLVAMEAHTSGLGQEREGRFYVCDVNRLDESGAEKGRKKTAAPDALCAQHIFLPAGEK
jgi:hypothetical protein